jgi:hypothetical protein
MIMIGWSEGKCQVDWNAQLQEKLEQLQRYCQPPRHIKSEETDASSDEKIKRHRRTSWLK